jgi:putative CocE/NonD family hydrolase
MQTSPSVATPRLKALAASLIAACALSAAHAQTTTLGTRGLTSQPNPAVTSNAGATWTTYARGESYPNVHTLPLQFITLSTGKKVAVSVSMPANSLGLPVSGKFPAILTQTAYRIDVGNLMGMVVPKDTTLVIGGVDKYMVKRGYITVAVDAWGTGMSEGVTKLLGEEEQQAYGEAVKWVTQQKWFDGNLGVAGTSYLGISSLLTAGQGNPAIKAAFTVVPMGDPYRGTVATGGLLNANFLSKWLVLTQNLTVANGPAKLLNPWYASQIDKATKDHIAAINEWYFPVIDQGLAGKSGIATDDGTFWSVRSPLEKAANIRVPTFVFGSHQDIFQRDEPLLYEQLKRNVNTKLVIVPGPHFQAVLTALADNTSKQGAPSAEVLMLQWFDQYLKGKQTGAESLPNVTQFIDGWGASGEVRYASTTDWPHPAMTPQRWYLRGNLKISTQAPNGSENSYTIGEPEAASVDKSILLNSLAQAKVTLRDGSDCSVSNVQWTLGIAGLLPKDCQKDNAQVEGVQRAVLYETDVLTSDLYLNGPIQADIWMKATNTQAALSIRVDDVDPSTGTVKPLTNGLQSAAFRAVDPSRSRFVNGVMIQPWHPFTAASALPVVPGAPMLVPVEVFPAAAVIKAGHKLRIAISSSNQAQGIWPLDKQAEAKGNVSTILSDAAHPSSVVLPVVPTSALR